MSFNPQAFFNTLRRSGLFAGGFEQAQVDTINAVLHQMQGQSIYFIAYTLATGYHETGPRSRLIPNRESLYYTSAARIRKVWPTRFKSNAAAQPFVRNAKALANKVYNGRLGNRNGSNDGYNYRGGGLDHLTGLYNFTVEAKRQGVDLVENPDLITKPDVAVSSLVNGMLTGRYRSRKKADGGTPIKLADFVRADGGFNYVGARAIVNADVKKNGRLIAKHAIAFEGALRAGGYDPAEKPRPVDRRKGHDRPKRKRRSLWSWLRGAT